MTTALVLTSRDTMSRHARSFSLAAAFLPRDARDDAAVLYAFCRLVDDTADEATDPNQARASLDALLDELRGQRPPRPLVEAVQDVIARRDLDPVYACELVAGCRADLDPVRIADDTQLVAYGYAVAGTVGGLMSGVLGVTDGAALRHAVSLGIAMQLTNICRDVAEDAARGRVYLPADRLRAAGLSAEALVDGTADPDRVDAVVRDLLDLAEDHYATAWRGMRYIPLRTRFAVLVAARVYRQIGVRLRRRGGALRRRTVVPWPSKVAQVGLALAGALAPAS